MAATIEGCLHRGGELGEHSRRLLLLRELLLRLDCLKRRTPHLERVELRVDFSRERLLLGEVDRHFEHRVEKESFQVGLRVLQPRTQRRHLLVRVAAHKVELLRHVARRDHVGLVPVLPYRQLLLHRRQLRPEG